MLKIMGLMMIVLTGSLSGIYFSQKLSEKLQFLEECIEFMMIVETEIRYTRLYIPEIICKYEGEKSFRLCLKICLDYIKSGLELPSAWTKAFLSKKYAPLINDEQRRIIIDFGCGLGTNDIDGQTAHCRYYQELIKPQVKSAFEDKRVKSRLYVILGTCLGIAVELLLL